jgi:hypothetical protein
MTGLYVLVEFLRVWAAFGLRAALVALTEGALG